MEEDHDDSASEAESAGAKADETYLIGSSKNFDEEGKPLHFRHFLDDSARQ